MGKDAPLIQAWVGHARLSTTLGYFTSIEKHVLDVLDDITSHPASIRNSSNGETTAKTINRPLNLGVQAKQKILAERTGVPLDFILSKAANNGKRF